MATMDEINKTVADLREVVQNAKGDRVLDQDQLVATFTKALDKWNATNSAEALRKGGASDVVQSGPAKAEVQIGDRVKSGKFAGHRVEDVMFTDWLLSKAAAAGAATKPASAELKSTVEKALTATGSGTGDEYVPTQMASALWNDFFLASRVVSQFPAIAMPTDPFDIPLGWGSPTWRKGTQNTATTVSDPATAKSTLTSTENVCEINFSYNLDEDAVIAVLPTLRDMLAREGGEQLDRFMMNADSTNAATGNINLDDADPDDDSYYLSSGQDGLRHLMLVDNTAQSTDINTTLTDALLRTAIGKLGKYATDPGRLVMFTNPKTYAVSMLGLTNVATVDKYGPNATIVSGELARYQGIPVVPTSSIALAEDDGKLSTTGSNNDEGTIVIAHRDMWRAGFRRNLLLEVFRDVQKRSIVLVASFRVATAAFGTRSTATHVAGIHGINY